ncbi:hypothetical protein [Vibrio metoecus]|uniref:hypothetical protein n=1 Tax=Vibrio metoecus TaxID=1481663 RepID=UPI00189E5352|nr:hypothetical protein [Vibrio metoecus]
MHITKLDGALILEIVHALGKEYKKTNGGSVKNHQTDDRKAKRFKNKEIGLARQKICR